MTKLATMPTSRSAAAEVPPTPFARFSPNVEIAWQESFMASFDLATVDDLLRDAREVKLEAGEIFYRGTHHADTATIALVIEGLLRIVVGDHEGREMTLRYATEGAVVGLPAVIIAGAPVSSEQSEAQWRQVGGDSLSGEALQDSRILKLPAARFRRMTAERADIAWPVARYLARETIATQQLLVAGVFMPVRARVARHLLDLARRDGSRFVVGATHQEIANAIGTVREVVSRVLRNLAGEGLVAREGADLVLIDSAALHAISTGRSQVGPRSLPEP